MELTIGCTTRPYNKLSFAAACEHIAAAGYSDVAVFANEGQVPVRSDSTAEEIVAAKKAAADAGLIPSYLIGRTLLNLGLEDAVDAYKRLIDNAAELGAKWLLDCGIGNEELFDDYFELMRRSAPHAQQAGIQLTLKPHGGITLTADDLLKANERVNHPAFGICFDPGNIIHYTKGELRPETDVERVAPVVNTAIIKDCALDGDKPNVNVKPGTGLVDFTVCLNGLINNGFRGPLYVECLGGETLEEIDENARDTLKFVQDILRS